VLLRRPDDRGRLSRRDEESALAMIGRFRSNLRSSVAASAAPYGYTITVWSSGAVAIDLLGKPHVSQVLVFMACAVAAFLATEILAFGALAVRRTRAESPTVAVWGSAHWASAGIAIVSVWAVDHGLGGYAGWAASGFLATALYLLLNATQVTLAALVADRRSASR
jgi:hypothetical protein